MHSRRVPGRVTVSAHHHYYVCAAQRTHLLSGAARSVISCGVALSCGVADQCTRTTSNAEYAEKRNSSSPCAF
jgi:hypothetical protein